MLLNNAMMRAVMFISALVPMAAAQQFHQRKMAQYYPGISKSCQAALNSTIECDYILSDTALSQEHLDLGQLNAMCTTECHESLLSIQEYIVGNCTASGDVIHEGQDQLPATWVNDNFILTIEKYCAKDP